jgi:hypothetical protein
VGVGHFSETCVERRAIAVVGIGAASQIRRAVGHPSEQRHRRPKAGRQWPLVHILATMSSSNPSAVTTALIALGGAVIGGLITVVGQVIVENGRAKHESELETERAAVTAEAQQRADRIMMRSAARSLLDDYLAIKTRCALVLNEGRWWTAGSMRPPRTTAEDHRMIAAHASSEVWTAVAQARGEMEYLEMMREASAGAAPIAVRTRELIAEHKATIDHASEAVMPLARDD